MNRLGQHFSSDQLPLDVGVFNQEQFHWHSTLELICILQGTCEIEIGYRCFTLNEDDLCIVDCNRPHYIKNLSEDTLYLSICIDLANHFKGIIPHIYGNLIEFNPLSNYDNKSTIERKIKSLLAKAIRGFYQNNITEINNNAKSLLRYLVRNCDNYNSMFFDINDNRSERVRSVTQYLYENCEEKISLAEIASLANVSVSYLSHLFKDITGFSFQYHISSIRSENSVKLLLASDYNMTNISFNCGFSDPKYFNKMFIQLMNLTPVQYRKKYKRVYQDISNMPAKDLKYVEKIKDIVSKKINRYL